MLNLSENTWQSGARDTNWRLIADANARSMRVWIRMASVELTGP